jgi:hypothetical protein
MAHLLRVSASLRESFFILLPHGYGSALVLAELSNRMPLSGYGYQ